MKPLRAERAYPIRGIREDLPSGERVLWQGAPAWRDLACTAFHLRQVAVYFAVLLALRLGFQLAEGASAAASLRGALPLVISAAAALALLAGLALWSARTTIYAITTRRVVIRVGMALPLDVNLPYTGIEAASLALRPDGHGDLPLVLQGGVRLAYAHLWPYARPWKLAAPQPMLRAVAGAAGVAQILAQALATSSGTVPSAAEAAVPATPAIPVTPTHPAGTATPAALPPRRGGLGVAAVQS
ncbi:MAG: PH domain-containing protein [Burkholderiales bacterium]|nr:PH domain-containing protein [Burkholderiales bacterium]